MKEQSLPPMRIRDRLLTAMREEEYADCPRLPRENVLSEQLGISRTQLRDVLALLEQEGFITRRHGVGTVINHHVLAAESRMDIEVEFMDMIRQAGRTPGLGEIRVLHELADQEMARRLQVEEGSPLLRVSRVCTGDRKPVIYCEDVLPEGLICLDYEESDLEQPIFQFLRDFCRLDSYLDLTEVRPVTADEKLSEILQVPVGAPLLFMDETDYDIDGKPVFCSAEYFADGVFHHTVMRKRL